MLFGRSAMKKAIESNDSAAVADLLAQHPDMATKRGARGWLSTALQKADDDIVFALSNAKWNLLEAGLNGHTALEEAAHYARCTIIKTWIDQFPLLWSEQDRAKLLNIVLRKNDIDTLRFLIENRLADPDALPGYWDKALNIAVSQKNGEAVQLIRAELARRADEYAVTTPAPVVKAANVDVEWHMVDAATIMRVRDVAAAGYRLTDIFNFAMGTCTSVQRNLETNAETAVTIDLTAPAATAAVKDAHARLLAAGGTPPALAQAVRINKPTGANDV